MTEFPGSSYNEGDPDPSPTPPFPTARVVVQFPGLPQQAIDAPSVIVVAAPDFNNPGACMFYVHTPSDLHYAILVANIIAGLRKQHGDAAVANALRFSRTTEVGEMTPGPLNFSATKALEEKLEQRENREKGDRGEPRAGRLRPEDLEGL